MQPLISVIIPTLNEENYLPKLLEDLKKQTRKSFEVIVVDAHSDDMTKKVANTFHKDFDFHFLESSKRQNSLQRNLGAEKAKGEYLFFMDADTRVPPDTIEKLEQHIREDGNKVYMPVIVSSNPGWAYRSLVAFTIFAVQGLQKIGKHFSLGGHIVIKKSLFDRLHGFDLQVIVSEDHNLITRAHQMGADAQILFDAPCVFSMRRWEREGIGHVLVKYAWFNIETFIRGGVYSKSLGYEMGGHNYKKALATKTT
jgi:glycosyltransferase involved in cell wall biosynthesis